MEKQLCRMFSQMGVRVVFGRSSVQILAIVFVVPRNGPDTLQQNSGTLHQSRPRPFQFFR
jgi:hypothetical protein